MLKPHPAFAWLNKRGRPPDADSVVIREHPANHIRNRNELLEDTRILIACDRRSRIPTRETIRNAQYLERPDA